VLRNIYQFSGIHIYASTCSLTVFSSFVSFGAGDVKAGENGIFGAVSTTTKIAGKTIINTQKWQKSMQIQRTARLINSCDINNTSDRHWIELMRPWRLPI